MMMTENSLTIISEQITVRHNIITACKSLHT